MWIKSSTVKLQRAAKENIPPNWDTWEMERHVVYENLKDIWFVRTEAPYSIFIHEGTKFFKRPNPFMTRALEENEDSLIEGYKTLLRNHIKQLWLS